MKPQNTYTKAECNRFFVHFEVLANLILVVVYRKAFTKEMLCVRDLCSLQQPRQNFLMCFNLD